MQAKTTAERQKEFRERMRALGLKEIRGLFAKPEDEQRIRNYVDKLNKPKG